MNEYKFAHRVENIEESGVRKIFNIRKGVSDVVDFSLGQPSFDVPDKIKNATCNAINNGFNKYTLTQGLPEFREKLLAKLEKKYNKKIEDIIITGGASACLFFALMVLVDEGDEVIIPDPYFVLYKPVVKIFGGRPVLVDTYPDFRLRGDKLKKAISPRTKILIFNNPVNPTGVEYSASEVKIITDIARRHNLILISDEVYEEFVYDFQFESAFPLYENTILINSFSKTYGMPGWRLGYACGPKEIIKKMLTLQQFSFVCAPTPLQKGCISALSTDVKDLISQYKKKRDIIYDGLKDVFEVVRPQGTFYIFPKVPWGKDQEFVKEAIKNKVLVVSGGTFSERNTHFRISFATDDDTLERGIKILKKLAKKKI